jgi:hypothetical protein
MKAISQEDALFPTPAQPKTERPKSIYQAEEKPKWTRHRPVHPAKCDHCLAVLAEKGGRGGAARMACYKRTADGKSQLLCYQHMALQREADGMKALR